MIEAILFIVILFWLFGRSGAPALDPILLVLIVLLLLGGVGHFAYPSHGYYY